jgi:PIN domain nuclease of toxin-antitoxin system
MILLDTHAWLWYATESPKLSENALKAIQQTEKAAVLSVSCWEIAMQVEKKRIGLDRDVAEWITLALQRPKITLLPLEPKAAVLAAQLRNFHGDPIDRFLAATSLTYQIPLVTKDELIQNWGQIEIIW